MFPRLGFLMLPGLLVSLHAGAENYYLCADPKTGQKTAQDFPCRTGKAIRSYEAASPAELDAREAASRQYKREFERRHPGTYRPEEYMTEQELAAHNADRENREAERKKREQEEALRETARRAAEAERRAAAAERAAQEAQARAAAAEEAGRQQPILLVPVPASPPVLHPQPRPRSVPRCDREDCREDVPRREPRETPPASGRRPL
ncbi:MAG: hypothetical protein AB1544_07155 [Pseudomonadota bacterium]|jgi:hypothetical protein